MIYLDSSALVKLVVRERESSALLGFLRAAGSSSFSTSALARAETLRAASRRGEGALSKAREVLGGVAELTITEAILNAAGELEPPGLRTLDAIHLASALELGKDLESFVAYDERLIRAAQVLKLPAASPR